MIVSILNSLLTSSFLFSAPTAPTDRWLVELRSTDVSCLHDWWNERGMAESTYLKKPLPIGNWWVIEIPSSDAASLRDLPCVMRITEDKKIDWRDNVPNDPAYINQADMNLIGMTKAWDIATGGVTAQGDTIVVAIMDNGYQLDHEDLAGNIWFNKGEIPGDGLDNDDNGYEDDYVGLNVSLGNDNHPELAHGTSVCGIIGARGNNMIGVTGVNWNVKMMLISGADFESQLIEGYQYVLDMRKKYHQTNGAEGAFVVVTNTSGGVNGALAVDHPLWCEMYDKLGEEGILSVCAAPNNPISVDVEGDMPTTCTSPYMIAVTNVDLTDELVGNAGFGHISIDIGAPGHGTITISAGDQYKEFLGTSSSTPHVSGAIALMYSTSCASFLFDVLVDPAGTAARIRDIIFTSAKTNNSLDEITTTGRRLQVDAALKASVAECDQTSTSELQILSIRPNPVRLDFVEVFFDVKGDTSAALFELYSPAGTKVYQIPISQEEFTLGHLRIDTGPLPAGIYMLTLRNKKEKATQKIFVY